MNDPQNTVDPRLRKWFDDLQVESGTEGTLPDSFINSMMDGSIFSDYPRLAEYEEELGLKTSHTEFGQAMSALMSLGRK